MFDEKEANFSGITDNASGLHISKLIQKAVIEVNEEGSEAAAATGAIFVKKIIGTPIIPSFVCDHPFMFFIKDSKTDLILFMGRVTDPTSKQ